MNSKEKKINIEVKVADERISLIVPISRQDDVRQTESEIEIKLKQLRARFPGKGSKELLAMVTYEFASMSHFLTRQRQQEAEEAEELLKEAARLCGDADEFDVL